MPVMLSLDILFGSSSLKPSLEYHRFSYSSSFLKVSSKKDNHVSSGHIVDLRAQPPREITWKDKKDMDAAS